MSKPWKIAEAKAKFSQLLEESHVTPQIICNREDAIAVVINIEEYTAFSTWKKQQEQGQIGSMINLIQKEIGKEPSSFKKTKRTNRVNPIAK